MFPDSVYGFLAQIKHKGSMSEFKLACVCSYSLHTVGCIVMICISACHDVNPRVTRQSNEKNIYTGLLVRLACQSTTWCFKDNKQNVGGAGIFFSVKSHTKQEEKKS